MKFYYGDKNLLRVLDEMDFWKQQEAEHTIVILEVVPNLDSKFVTELKEYELAFTQTQQRAVQLAETVIRSKGEINQTMKKHIIDVINYSIEESRRFVAFLSTILKTPPVSQDPIAKAVINHIIRESEYYIGISQTILYSQ